MVKHSELTKSTYRLAEVAKLFDVVPETMKNWERQGKVKFGRTPTNIRILDKESLISFLKENDLFVDDLQQQRHDVIYSRVLTNDDMDDLEEQVKFIVEEAPQLNNIVILKDVNSSFDDKREQFDKLIKMVKNKEVARVFVTSENRLSVSGFSYLKGWFAELGTEIVVVERQSHSENDIVGQEILLEFEKTRKERG